MKRRIIGILLSFLGIFIWYSICTWDGALRWAVFLRSHDLVSAYTAGIEEVNSNILGAKNCRYFQFDRPIYDHESGNTLALFESERVWIFVRISYWGAM